MKGMRVNAYIPRGGGESSSLNTSEAEHFEDVGIMEEIKKRKIKLDNKKRLESRQVREGCGEWRWSG